MSAEFFHKLRVLKNLCVIIKNNNIKYNIPGSLRTRVKDQQYQYDHCHIHNSMRYVPFLFELELSLRIPVNIEQFLCVHL